MGKESVFVIRQFSTQQNIDRDVCRFDFSRKDRQLQALEKLSQLIMPFLQFYEFPNNWKIYFKTHSYNPKWCYVGNFNFYRLIFQQKIPYNPYKKWLSSKLTEILLRDSFYQTVRKSELARSCTVKIMPSLRYKNTMILNKCNTS